MGRSEAAKKKMCLCPPCPKDVISLYKTWKQMFPTIDWIQCAVFIPPASYSTAKEKDQVHPQAATSWMTLTKLDKRIQIKRTNQIIPFR